MLGEQVQTGGSEFSPSNFILIGEQLGSAAVDNTILSCISTAVAKCRANCQKNILRHKHSHDGHTSTTHTHTQKLCRSISHQAAADPREGSR